MRLARPFLHALISAVSLSFAVGCERSAAPSAGNERQETAAPGDEAATDAGADTPETPAMFTVTSPAFEQDARIAVRYTGDGDDISPELQWSSAPQGTVEFALIMDDPDAPTTEPWVHWVIYKIPAAAVSLLESVAKVDSPASPAGALQGENSFGNVGYGGPAPPQGHGVHHYHFKLYALGSELSVVAGLTKTQILQAMEGHVLGQAEIIGTYER